jgi:hypothetical protein
MFLPERVHEGALNGSLFEIQTIRASLVDCGAMEGVQAIRFLVHGKPGSVERGWILRKRCRFFNGRRSRHFRRRRRFWLDELDIFESS